MRKGLFPPLRVQFPNVDDEKPFSAFLRLQEMRDQELKPQITNYPLGGFPRTFAAEKDKLSSSSQRRQSALRRERSRQSGDRLTSPDREVASTSEPSFLGTTISNPQSRQSSDQLTSPSREVASTSEQSLLVPAISNDRQE